jgi:hypothetical protein
MFAFSTYIYKCYVIVSLWGDVAYEAMGTQK